MGFIMTIAAIGHLPHNSKLSQATKCNTVLSPESSFTSSLKFCLQIVLNYEHFILQVELDAFMYQSMICSRHLRAPIFSWHFNIITWSILSPWTLLTILKVHFDGVYIFTDCTSSFHGAYSNPFPRISSAGKALTSKGGSSFSDSLPIITPNTLLFCFTLTTPTRSSGTLRFASLYTSQWGLQVENVRMGKNPPESY